MSIEPSADLPRVGLKACDDSNGRWRVECWVEGFRDLEAFEIAVPRDVAPDDIYARCALHLQTSLHGRLGGISWAIRAKTAKARRLLRTARALRAADRPADAWRSISEACILRAEIVDRQRERRKRQIALATINAICRTDERVVSYMERVYGRTA